MTREEAKKQALGRLKLSMRADLLEMRADLLEQAGQVADEILQPIDERDSKAKLPYNYGPADVLSLERAIRRRLKL